MTLLYILGAVVLINAAYFLLFSKFSFLKPISNNPSLKQDLFPVSLIVCAKNEAENLQNHIPLWLQQEYPNFEIILINDASADETLEIMEAFAEKDPRIKIVNVENNEAFWGNKKYSLTLGIKKAKNERMIFTDADCKPASNQWLREMALQFSKEKQLILGFGGYLKFPGFLNKLIRYETLMTALQYFSYAKAGIPYMGVGRNLAYTSTLYYKNNGFMSHIKVQSGDDDLFVNEAATAENTAICFSENAFTYSIPKKTWTNWILQKKRHYSTAKLYKPTLRILLGLFYISNLLFWLLAIASLLFSDWRIALILIAVRFLLQYIVVGKAAKKFKSPDLVPFIPFFELYLIFVQLSIFIGSSEKKQQWK